MIRLIFLTFSFLILSPVIAKSATEGTLTKIRGIVLSNACDSSSAYLKALNIAETKGFYDCSELEDSYQKCNYIGDAVGARAVMSTVVITCSK